MLTKEEQMEPEMTCRSNDTTKKGKLYMASELSQKEWKLGFSVGPGQALRLRSIPGRALAVSIPRATNQDGNLNLSFHY